LPKKQADFVMQKQWLGRHMAFDEDSIGNNVEGMWLHRNNTGTKIELRNVAFRKECLIHEFCHELFAPNRVLTNFLNKPENLENISEKDKDLYVTTFNEGLTELTKQIVDNYYSGYSYLRTYSNETSLVFHLLKSVNEMFYKNSPDGQLKSLKEMIEWGTVGGNNKDFAKHCKLIRTSSFPCGIDICNINQFDASRIKQFVAENKFKDPDIKSFMLKLKTSIVS
jgi:hypothetical protein